MSTVSPRSSSSGLGVAPINDNTLNVRNDIANSSSVLGLSLSSSEPPEKTSSSSSTTTTTTMTTTMAGTSAVLGSTVAVSSSSSSSSSSWMTLSSVLLNSPISISDDVLMSASWPNAVPLQEEDDIITIVCGNSRLHWALHRGRVDEYYPTLFWKTTPPVVTDIPKPKLYDYIPSVVKDIIYGPVVLPAPTQTTSVGSTGITGVPGQSGLTGSTGVTGLTGSAGPTASAATTTDTGATSSVAASTNAAATAGTTAAGAATTAAGSRRTIPAATPAVLTTPAADPSRFYTTARAAAHRSTYRIPALSVYILSTNENHLKGVTALFKNAIPCKLYNLTTKDFTIPQQILTHQYHTNTTTTTTTTNSNTATTTTTSAKSETTSGSDPSTISAKAVGYYKEIGVDRVCALEGAKFLCQPSPNDQQTMMMVIDGGTAMTYTATDRHGNFMGGGIGPGLRMKFRSLFDYTASLPYITYDVLMKTILHQHQQPQDTDSKSNIVNSQGPKLQQFATTGTEHSIMGCVLKETASNLTSIIYGWMTDILQRTSSELKPLPNSNSTTFENQPPKAVVVLTGGDCEIFDLLLKEKHSNIVQCFDEHDSMFHAIQTAIKQNNLEIIVNKYLLHHGIQSMLLQHHEVKQRYYGKVPPTKPDTTTILSTVPTNTSTISTLAGELSNVRDSIVGQRVAMIAGLGDVTTTSIVCGSTEIPKRAAITYGSITHVIPNNERPTLDKDFYTVFWDATGSIDDITPRSLYDYLMLYFKSNEKSREKDDERRVKLANKANDSKKAADLLAQHCNGVRAMIQSRMQILNAANRKPPPHNPASTTASPSISVVPTTTANTTDSTTATSATLTLGIGAPPNSNASAITGTKRNYEDSTPGAAGGVLVAIGGAGNTAKKGKRSGIYPIPTASLEEMKDQTPKFYIKRRIAKDFDGEIYYGTVKKWIPSSENDEGVDLWLIEYDDGDAEDLERHELMEGFRLWFLYNSKDVVGNKQQQQQLQQQTQQPQQQQRK